MINFSKEQIFIVTGASSGIGEGIAKLLNELGATVIGIARSKERLEKMKSECKYPERMFLEIKDLADDIESLPQYVKELKNKYGKFSGLAYCAGYSVSAALSMIEYKDLVNIFNVDFFAPTMFLKGFSDRRNNIGQGASVVMISSIASHLCDRGMTLYSSAKAALTTMSRIAASEVVKSGLRINVLSPSDIKTPMTMNKEDRALRGGQELLYPFGYGEVDDVANMAVFMLSNATKWITRQDYILDCGHV